MGDFTRRFSRRQALGGALGGFFAFALRHRRAEALAVAPTGRAKHCLVLWMNGGPSQFETFDPKPGTQTGGELAAVRTDVTGLSICETLPQIAQRCRHLSMIRNITSAEGEHVRAQYYLHTGYRFVPAFPRPALGSIASHEASQTPFPNYVTIGSPGYGPAYLGPDHAPFSIEDPREARQLLLGIRRRQSQIQLLQELGSSFDRQHPAAMLKRRVAMIERIESMASTPFVDALDFEKEPARQRRRYGDGRFAEACITARRLIECGVPFVEIQHDGWDTHSDNTRNVRRLCEQIDQPWAVLLDDLEASGLLDETIVLWLGEFGRTPAINANRGRDHFPQITQAVIGGSGLGGGRVVGQTDTAGREILGDTHSVADLFATVLSAMGIDPSGQFETAFGSPTSVTDGGTPILVG